MLSKLLSLAEVWGLRPDGSNPCGHVKHYKERKREPFLSPEGTERLGEILDEAEREMASAVADFRLLLLTGCWLPEIQLVCWEYIKGDCDEPAPASGGVAHRDGQRRLLTDQRHQAFAPRDPV